MKTIQIDNHGQTETYILEKYATLSDYALMQKIGGSVLLCSICIDYSNPVDGDFLPLGVQYIEKMYAIGKIPQGFIKKEGKPNDNEILISRLIDRSLRPLFPKDFPYSTQITIFVLSYDGKSDLCKNAMNLASICLYLSSIPTNHTQILSATRITCHNGIFTPCNTIEDLTQSSLDLFVSGIGSEITMIEMQALKTTQKIHSANNHIDSKAHDHINSMLDKKESNLQENSNEIKPHELLEAIAIARNIIHQTSCNYTKHFESYKKQKFNLEHNAIIDTYLKNTLQMQYGDIIEQYLHEMAQTESFPKFQTLIQHIAQEQNLDFPVATKYIHAIKKELMRSMVLTHGIRADGRSPIQIRPIDIESNFLPHVHGSACFTRGQTQALVTCTLGSQHDAQVQEGMMANSKSKIIFHYNFPPFSVGEAYPIGASSRRELGHGNLALKAIESNIPDTQYTIRLVSEILQSNGSSSMASVCGATLAMLGAGVEMHNMVAGIAMGLIYDNEEKFVILSDITGLEDFDGDMDFKVTGNEKGLTALQLDIKISSLSENILKASLLQAQEGIIHILSTMKKIPIQPNYDLLPQKESFALTQGRVSDIIGQGGKTIREIIAKFNVNIELDKDQNIVNIIGNNRDSINNAKTYIIELLRKKELRKELPYKPGEIYEGIIKKYLDFGIIIELPHGGTGLLRTTTYDNMEIGQKISICILSNNHGKIDVELSNNQKNN